MDPAFLESLRCPIDPDRLATLSQDRDGLICSTCATRFPIKNGLPVLVADQAELPDRVSNITQLPCQRRS